MSRALSPRRTGALAGAMLLAVYVATLAPSVTFWDAGEFIAATHAFGIPHPPGTPLLVLLLSAWARLWFFLPFATATNLFSAVTTAVAGGLTAYWVARRTTSSAAGLAAAVVAGAMSSVWQNATETEVYAVSLALAMTSVVAADRLGRDGDRRWLIVAAYLLALAVPLHVSALVAAPAVVLLAADRGDGTIDWSSAFALGAVSIIAIGVSRLSLMMVIVGIVPLWFAPMLRDTATRNGVRRERAALFLVVTTALSVLLVMLVRAAHDPAINQANPRTFSSLLYAIGRRQYDLPGMWPRQAPLWIQLANWFEYADWQFALSLAPSVIPSPGRVAMTVIFAGLALLGARWHRRRDERTWRAVLVLLVCGTLGVIFYLNLKAGTSFGWQFVPDADAHEARDRDYFFVLGFWAWGMWAGMGGIALAERLRWRREVGLVVAAVPVLLNWTAVNRRSEPEASLPREVARELLDPLPPRAVLFVAGDNDTYPLWYAQQVERRRRDVTIVTVPLLGAPWYAAELTRRYGLTGTTAPEIAAMARSQARPVAAALTLDAETRGELAVSWTVKGLVALDTYSLGPDEQHQRVIAIDRVATLTAANRIDAWRQGREARSSIDPVNEYFIEMLSCPRRLVDTSAAPERLAVLDSVCNVPRP